MARLNHHYTKLSGGYLFPEIGKRAAILQEAGASLINLGIGDIAQKLTPAIHQALLNASDEMGNDKSFRGYGPSQGYSFLRNAIAQGDYGHLDITADEIFVSNGAKNDLANLQELFSTECRIAIPNPTYPVYIDTNVMAGRTRPALKKGGYGGVVYLSLNEGNDFSPVLPERPVDLVYLCSPNNPTGAAMSREDLTRWVQYAKKNEAVLLFDGAYEAYIQSDAPRSIYEIPGAKEVAIEVRSFSKTAGFTGLRCSYTVVPHALKIMDGLRPHSLHALWARRQDTKFGGVPYPIQRAAEAVYSESGAEQVRTMITDFMRRADILRKGLEEIGYTVYGGKDAPYLWLKIPPTYNSWSFFDFLLEKAHVISVPGSGFGTEGEGYVRLSSFAPLVQIEETLARMRNL